jgi:hypothetical protein
MEAKVGTSCITVVAYLSQHLTNVNSAVFLKELGSSRPEANVKVCFGFGLTDRLPSFYPKAKAVLTLAKCYHKNATEYGSGCS